MLNEKMREQMMEDVREWMQDNIEWSADFLYSHGNYWANETYDLEDLLDDIEDGELYALVNLIIDADLGYVSDCDKFFFDCDGNLKKIDDLEDAIYEFIDVDDDIVDMLLDDIDEGLVDDNDLMEIIKKYSLPSWDDVEYELKAVFNNFCRHSNQLMFDGYDFVYVCKEVALASAVKDYLISTKFCNADESEYSRIIGDLDGDNLLPVLMSDTSEYIEGMHIPLEKALEIVVKNEYLKGRWF